MIRILISLTIIISMTTTAFPATEKREYKRSEWRYWTDVDKDCENTREEALVRDAIVVFYTNDLCTPKFGLWRDPYTDKFFMDSSSLDADHIIPLKHAHDNGGSSWTRTKKEKFANDPLNIIMVSASANRSKGAKAPNEWMPTNEDFHCEYLVRWRELKHKYLIMISRAEASFINYHLKKKC